MKIIHCVLYHALLIYCTKRIDRMHTIKQHRVNRATMYVTHKINEEQTQMAITH